MAGAPPPPPTFDILLTDADPGNSGAGKILSFSGTASGDVTITETSGVLSFSRSGITATTTVAITDLASSQTTGGSGGIPALGGQDKLVLSYAVFDSIYTRLNNTAALKLTDTSLNLSALDNIENFGSGHVDATSVLLATDGDGVTALDLLVTKAGNSGNTIHMNPAVALTLSDSTIDLGTTAILAIRAATTGNISLANAMYIVQGTASLVRQITDAKGNGANQFVLMDNVEVSLSDTGVVTATDLLAIDAKTTGMIDAISATTLQGSLVDVANVSGKSGCSSGEFWLKYYLNISISDTGTLSATDANLAAMDGNTDGNISLANISTLTGTLAEIKALTDAKGTNGNQFDLKADIDILASDSTASASIINAIDTQNGNGTIKTSHGGGNGSWTITGVNTLTVNATASQDTFEFGSGDGGVTINGFEKAVDKLDLSGELGGPIDQTSVTYAVNNTCSNNSFIAHRSSSALDVLGVLALFSENSAADKMGLSLWHNVLFLHQDDSGTDFAAQIFLVANNANTINVTQIATLTGISTLDYTNIVGLIS